MLETKRRVVENPWAIVGRKPDTHLKSLDVEGRTLRERAGLEDVRILDLRQSYASRALALGESPPIIEKLLGHKQIETTARYAHLEDDSVHASAEPCSCCSAVPEWGWPSRKP